MASQTSWIQPTDPEQTPFTTSRSVHAPRFPFGEERRFCLQRRLPLGPPLTVPARQIRVTLSLREGDDNGLLALFAEAPFRKRVSVLKG